MMVVCRERTMPRMSADPTAARRRRPLVLCRAGAEGLPFSRYEREATV